LPVRSGSAPPGPVFANQVRSELLRQRVPNRRRKRLELGHALARGIFRQRRVVDCRRRAIEVSQALSVVRSELS
jgi:hypothetical protein